MTKRDLYKKLAERTGERDGYAKIIVQRVLDILRDTMISGETIELRGFGVFRTRIRRARVARDIRRALNVNVPERKIIKFRFTGGNK